MATHAILGASGMASSDSDDDMEEGGMTAADEDAVIAAEAALADHPESYDLHLQASDARGALLLVRVPSPGFSWNRAARLHQPRLKSGCEAGLPSPSLSPRIHSDSPPRIFPLVRGAARRLSVSSAGSSCGRAWRRPEKPWLPASRSLVTSGSRQAL